LDMRQSQWQRNTERLHWKRNMRRLKNYA